ncbi:MAG: hypothetical protein ACOCXP_03580 [Candidatus Dojkabacteria bacterium]
MEAFLDLITLNENVDYTFVIYCAVSYIALLWIVVSAWVAKDAHKRYEGNDFASALWFFIVFIFNFPGFMFYLVVRPEEMNENTYFGGGVNIPLANFVDKNEDFVMGIQLKINNTELTEQVRDMRLSLDWESDDPKKKLNPAVLSAETKQVEKKLVDLQKLIALFNKADKKEERKEDQVKVRTVQNNYKPAEKKEIKNTNKPKPSKNIRKKIKKSKAKKSSK